MTTFDDVVDLRSFKYRLCIFGSRTYKPSVAEIDRALANAGFPRDNIVEVVCGMARGCDIAGAAWVQSWAIRVKEMPADWGKYGNNAGRRRNRAMAEYCDAALGFWHRSSAGTANMTAHLVALRKRIALVEVSP